MRGAVKVRARARARARGEGEGEGEMRRERGLAARHIGGSREEASTVLREPRVLAVVGTCNEVLDGHEPLPEQCGPLAEADIVIEDAHNDERGDVMHGQDELDASIRVANRAIGQLAALGCRRREVELAHLHLSALRS